MNMKDYLSEHRILTDGAMGTYFDLMDQDDVLCSEQMNITNPEIIKKIHLDYIESGAQLIRCNTFMSNRDTLKQIQAKYSDFEDIQLKEFVQAGYDIASEIERSMQSQGKIVFAAADIGPIKEDADHEREELVREYLEICEAFLERDCRVFVFETFPDEYYVLRMADYIKERNPDAWLLGQFSFMPTGYGSTGFHYSTVLTRAINSGKLDAVGLNCGVGAFHMRAFLKEYLGEYQIPKGVKLSALPNCGYPQIVRGKAVYSDSVPYFSMNMKEIAQEGIAILGGCCGTTPEYIAAISSWIFEEKLTTPTRIIVQEKKKSQERPQEKNRFREKLLSGEKVFAVELDPPFDTDYSKLMDGAKALIGSKTDIITLADSPLGRSRADSLLMAAKVKRESGMDVMPHLSCRDRNRISVRGGILGSYLNDIRNYLLVTGDPVPRMDRDNTKSVFDFNSISCMRYVKHLNESLFAEDPLFYGGALNQDGSNSKAIASRMLKKMEEGCSYFLTQPVYTEESAEKLRILQEMTGAKILVGILPLVSYRNALFMQNEMPGISVSDEIVSLYKERDSREEWEKIAVDTSIRIMQKCEKIGAGYYIMTPFNRVSLVKRIQEAL